MKPRVNRFNPKRQLLRLSASELEQVKALAGKVRYGGNPEHKRNPGDFGLTPPSGPGLGKSLCDAVQVFSHAAALSYLREGLRRGLVSAHRQGAWPQLIWSVTEEGQALEAQLENADTGQYHGYPMPASDPLAAEVIRRWRETG